MCNFLKIKSLNLSNCINLTYSGIRSLTKLCTNLEVLNLSNCEGISDKCILSIAENCTSLRELELCNIRGITDRSAKFLFQMPSLRHLNLQYCLRLTDKTAKEVLNFNTFPKIEYLNFSGCSGLSTNGLRYIITKCKYIQHLVLDHCNQVTDNLISDIIFKSDELRYLSLRNTPNINEDFLAYLRDATPKRLETIVLMDNPQLILPDVRRVVSTKKYKIIGATIDIIIIRNRMTLPKFMVRMNEFDKVEDLLDKIEEYLKQEDPGKGWSKRNFRLRRVTYRKNGTKRPSTFVTQAEYSYLVREVLDRKQHLYLEQNINLDYSTNQRLWQVNEGDIYITLRKWNPEKKCPEDIDDITVNSSMQLIDFKNYLYNSRIIPYPPHETLIIEEETDLRSNFLLADSLTLTLYGIISGDVIHVEEITPNILDERNQIDKSMTSEYLMKKKSTLMIQETEESFERRKKNLGFRADLKLIKLEIPIKSYWSFFKVKKRIAKLTGIGTEFIRISTRVEPHVYLYGNTKPIVDVISGNLWLLIDINSDEMLQEKIPLWIQRYDRNCRFVESKCITVRKTTTIKLLKEIIFEHFRIRDDRQILSRLSSKCALTNQTKYDGKPHLLKTLYTRDDLTIAETGLKYVRVDEVDREVTSNDLVLHVVKSNEYEIDGMKPQSFYDNGPQIFLVPADSNLYEVKRELAQFIKRREKLYENLDPNNIVIKLSTSTSNYSKDSFYEVKNSNFYNPECDVPVSTFISSQDVISWAVNNL